MTLVLCEIISISDLAEDLLRRVRLHTGVGWSTVLDGISDLRRGLLSLQKHQCAYCQGTIIADSNGLRELDHVLPKAAPNWLDFDKAISAEIEDRYHTNGYPAFCFEPRNIVLTCKQCNNFKGSFDSLANRTNDLEEYPNSGEAFISVHPHFHKYSDHIKITEEWLYQAKSEEGRTLIKVCKLDEAEVLARRMAAEAYAAQSEDICRALFKYFAQHDRLAINDCVAALCARFQIEKQTASDLLKLCFAAGVAGDVEMLAQAVSQARLLQDH